MRNTNRRVRVFGEEELAKANARVEASSAFGADDWDEAVETSVADCAELCGSATRSADVDIE